MYTKKRGSRSEFKAEMYSWLIQRRGGTIASLFYCRKTIFLSNQIKSKVLFQVGTFTNSTNISSHELLKSTCILRYELRDAMVPPLLCINQEYISALNSERLPLFLVYIDNKHKLSWAFKIDMHFKIWITTQWNKAF
jgi:hypothetical protein